MIRIKKGLDLPISGSPVQEIDTKDQVTKVAILGEEYIGMRPALQVKIGDSVKKGQVLFTDKRNLGVKFTAPQAGIISAISRGARRVLQFVEITNETGANDAISFQTYPSDQLVNIPRKTVVKQLVDSGLWTSFRTRPYSKIPPIDSTPSAIFITAIDTNPLAANPQLIIEKNSQAFKAGLDIVASLTKGSVFVCKGEISLPKSSANNVKEKIFVGKHPAGLVGTHVHFLHPVDENRTVWHLNYQDTIAIGELFLTGELNTTRVISLAGPGVVNPRLIKTIKGANLTQLTNNELILGDLRIISGSVLSGVSAIDYLGNYHLQVSVIAEDTHKEFLGWLAPGFNRHSVTKTFISGWLKDKLYAMTTSMHGSIRAMVPIGSYEKVMPLDIEPTLLLRDLLAQDTDSAQQLGVLELDEEDLALCTYVCPGKIDFAPLLRANLTKIEKEG